MTAAAVSLGLGLALVAITSALTQAWLTRRALNGSDLLVKTAEKSTERAEDLIAEKARHLETQYARQIAEAELQQMTRDRNEDRRHHEAQLAIVREGAGEIIADDATPDTARAAARKLLQNATPRDDSDRSTDPSRDDPSGLPRRPATRTGAGGDG